MTIMYDDLEYAGSRLVGTVVRTKCGKKLCYIHNIYLDSGVCDVSFLPSKRGTVLLDELDLSPFELGFFNASHIGYLVRMPSRQWKQGIRQQQLRNIFRGGLPSVSSASFINMALNKYPKLEECIESVTNQEVTDKAFSKHFCVSGKTKNPEKELALLFKNSCVGFLPTKKSTNIQPRFRDEYMFMSEFFEEVMEKQNAQ